jgi:hypothetical protein
MGENLRTSKMVFHNQILSFTSLIINAYPDSIIQEALEIASRMDKITGANMSS